MEYGELSRQDVFSALGSFSEYSKKVALKELIGSGTIESRTGSDGSIFYSPIEIRE